MASERTRGVKLHLNGQRMELSVVNPDRGEAREALDMTCTPGQPLSVGVNARYVMDMLSTLPKQGTVEVGVNDDVSPITVRVAGDTDYNYVVMPMRL